MRRLFLFTCLYFLSSAISAQKDSNLIIFQHANVIDGISNHPLLNMTVVVENGKIKDLQQNSKSVTTGIVIDLKGKWLLPGFIDAHVHFGNVDGARTALISGATTARSMASNHFMDTEMRERHHRGDNSIPEVIACGYQVRPDIANGFYEDFPEFLPLKPTIQGADNLRKIVRALIAHHVDVIKLFLTERSDNKPQDVLPKRTFTDEEIIAVVDEATKAGIPVAAHDIRNDEAAYVAVKSGVRSIEHGVQLSDKTLALMKMKGTYLVPTFSFWDQSPNPVLKIDASVLVERKRVYLPVLTDLVSRAYKMGVRVIGGTDTRYTEPGHTMADEALYLHKAGIPEMEVIKAITSSAAQCLGVQARTGSIKKGMEADLIIVAMDPLKALEALQDILMVINDGQIIVNKINQ